MLANETTLADLFQYMIDEQTENVSIDFEYKGYPLSIKCRLVERKEKQ